MEMYDDDQTHTPEYYHDDSSGCEDGCDDCEGVGDWCDIADRYARCKDCKCKQPHKIVWREAVPDYRGGRWGMATRLTLQCSVCSTERAVTEGFMPDERQMVMFDFGDDDGEEKTDMG